MAWTFRTLRRRIADWPPLTEAAGAVLAGYLRLVRATSRWDEDGYDAVKQAVAEHGAVILVFWHQRTFATPYVFDTTAASGRSLSADSRPGRVARAMLHRFGYQTTLMPKGRRGQGAVREVLRGLGDGVSIGIAVDGPRGPARQSKAYPVQWARATGKPIFVWAYSARRHVLWPSWDRQMLPLPFTTIHARWRRWDDEIPRRPDEAQMAALIESLNNALNEATDAVDLGNIGHTIARH